jgi:hypothetical protein
MQLIPNQSNRRSMVELLFPAQRQRCDGLGVSAKKGERGKERKGGETERKEGELKKGDMREG